MFLISTTSGETREKKELLGKLEPFEEGKGFFPKEIRIVDSKSLGMLDILMFSLCGPYKVEKEIFGFKVIDPEMYPLVFSWVIALNQVSEVKELIPPYENLEAVFGSVRNKTLESF
ncbi:LOW QUALITY PROTEIN: Glutathione S-transferase, C-terminal-like [Parasponia andersonii]|uniref:Glutathione S-transferase, C-terminal-like n=1 Tax=Parasponia andersonii TaxID=3476 RepID=A0A2P5C8K1_PARAD|nr:LOW QUALITY PROTEIN: Glutathione S-transferase, C-terminal-like [Parasponia andersonii]